MRRVIFAWELGGYLGHLWRLLPVAEALKARDVEVLFAVGDLVSATRLVGGHGFSFVQAPKPGPPSVACPRLLNYADILGQSGFDAPLNLASLMNGWRSLFGLFGPDCLLADHAPSALVAARTIGLPSVVVGGGFEVPPDTHPSPTFRVGEVVHLGRLLAADELVLKSINAVLQAANRPLIQRVADIFSEATVLLAGYPEMDHYGPRQGVQYIGALGMGTEGAKPVWSPLPGSRVFAYLHAEENVLALVGALRQVGSTSAVIVWPEMADRQVNGAPKGVCVTAHAVRLDEALHEADIVITEANFFTTAVALEQCKKMILLPRTAEQYLLADRLSEQGLARWLDSETTPYALTDLLMEVSNTSKKPPALSMQSSCEQPVEAVVSALLSRCM